MLSNKSSLYRIYRPTNFNDVAGHENIVEILKKELTSNAFGHAFLFAGQKGTGKTSVARIFAKAVNCEKLSAGEPCENCQNCQLANKNQMPDIYEIDAASNNGVDEIRNLKGNVSTLPLKGKYKIYIIDEVHMLSKGAFNALLKTLEEPPVHALFILATTEFAKIPPTIVSRCQTFNFKKIDKKSLIARLHYVTEKEKFLFGDDVAEEIYFLSDGSLRDGLNILEQLMIINDHEITLTSLKKTFYVASKKEKLKIIADILNNDAQDLITYFENAENQGMDFDVFALSLIEIIKEIIEVKLTNNFQFLKLLTPEEIVELKGELEQYFLIADQLSQAYAQTKGTGVSFNAILISLLKAIKPINQVKKLENSQPEEKKEVLETEVKNNQEFGEIATETSTIKMVENLEFVQPQPQPKVTGTKKEKTKILHQALDEGSLIDQKLKLISRFATKKYMVIENNDVINLLVGAVKEKRDLMENKVEAWFATDENANFITPQLANKFIAFYGGRVTAASDCEILLRFETEPGANLLKKELTSSEYQKKLTQELGSDNLIYVVDDDQWETLKKEFLFKKKTNALPSHVHIEKEKFYQEAVLKEKKVDKTAEFLEKASELFGDDLEIGD